MSDLPLVLVTEGADPAPLAWLRERARVVEAAPGSPAFDAALPDAAGMVVRTYTRVDAALLLPAIRGAVPAAGSGCCSWQLSVRLGVPARAPTKALSFQVGQGSVLRLVIQHHPGDQQDDHRNAAEPRRDDHVLALLYGPARFQNGTGPDRCKCVAEWTHVSVPIAEDCRGASIEFRVPEPRRSTTDDVEWIHIVVGPPLRPAPSRRDRA